MSSEWVWAKTGGNSWSVRRVKPLSVPPQEVFAGLGLSGSSLEQDALQDYLGRYQTAMRDWHRQARLPPQLQGAAQRTSCPLAQAIAGNVWAYLGGMDGKL